MNNEKKMTYVEPRIDVLIPSTEDILTMSNGWEADDDTLLIAE